jgi:predicted nucleic acid-binding protein
MASLATAVYDCMIFLQGAANPNGPAARAMQLVVTGSVRLFISEPILAEVRDVLARPSV